MHFLSFLVLLGVLCYKCCSIWFCAIDTQATFTFFILFLSLVLIGWDPRLCLHFHWFFFFSFASSSLLSSVIVFFILWLLLGTFHLFVEVFSLLILFFFFPEFIQPLHKYCQVNLIICISLRNFSGVSSSSFLGIYSSVFHFVWLSVLVSRD